MYEWIYIYIYILYVFYIYIYICNSETESSNNIYLYPGRKLTINFFSVYAPQIGLSVSVVEKDPFCNALLGKISTVSPDGYLLVWGDFKGNVGKAPAGFTGVHGEHRLGSRNADGI